MRSTCQTWFGRLAVTTRWCASPASFASRRRGKSEGCGDAKSCGLNRDDRRARRLKVVIWQFPIENAHDKAVGADRQLRRSAPAFCGAAAAGRLCHAAERNDGQMRLAVVAGDVQFEAGAWLAADSCMRPGARRTARPLRPRFDPRLAVRGKPAEINFIRRSTVERCMRAMVVVPDDWRH